MKLKDFEEGFTDLFFEQLNQESLDSLSQSNSWESLIREQIMQSDS